MMVNVEVNYRVNDRRSITRTLFCFRPFFIRLIEVLPHAKGPLPHLVTCLDTTWQLLAGWEAIQVFIPITKL